MLSRRHFLKNTVLAIPAYSLAGFLLSSCGKQIISPRQNGKKIGIIGAGIAGLQAAKNLYEQQYEVEIIEASDRIGGRIFTDSDKMQGFHVELGADSVYGEQNKWFQLLQGYTSIETTNHSPATYFINGLRYNQTEINNDSDYTKMLEKLKGMTSYQSGQDVSLSDYMQAQNIPERVKFIFSEISEDLIGTSVDRASLRLNSNEGIGKLNQIKHQYPNVNLSKVVEKNYQSILPYVLNNTPIASINYSGDQVLVTDKNQVVRTYDKLIVTVPLSILKLQTHEANHIKFVPELPKEKQIAMESLGMDSGVRVLLAVNQMFWHAGAKTLYTGGKIGKFDILHEDEANQKHLLSATISGEFAEQHIDMMNEHELLAFIKNEWKDLIGEDAANSIVDHKFKFWSKDPYIQGTFSYFKVGGNENSRQILAKPIDNKVFFAGEAYNTGKNSGTVQGAMETADIVSKSILELSV
ncbi:MAG: NAD(P)/FAD-dependent oxidoreductase [Bacteroidia bacterium]